MYVKLFNPFSKELEIPKELAQEQPWILDFILQQASDAWCANTENPIGDGKFRPVVELDDCMDSIISQMEFDNDEHLEMLVQEGRFAIQQNKEQILRLVNAYLRAGLEADRDPANL